MQEAKNMSKCLVQLWNHNATKYNEIRIETVSLCRPSIQHMRASLPTVHLRTQIPTNCGARVPIK